MKKVFLKQDFSRRPMVTQNAAGAMFSAVLKKTESETLKNVWD
jgi:hypothetical protein